MCRPECHAPRTPFCASLRSWNAHEHACHKLAESKSSLRGGNAHGHVRRAILCGNLQEKWHAPRIWKPRSADFVRACEIEMDMSQENKLGQILQEICCAPRTGTSFCASLRGRNAHGTSQKRKVKRKKTEKMMRPRNVKTAPRRLCASLRSRNAHGHLTRTLLCENLMPGLRECTLV